MSPFEFYIGPAVSLDLDIRSATLVVAPVPEPAAWATMIGGVGVIGAAIRKRRRARIALA